MQVIIILMFASLLVALIFLAGFIWAVRTGQYEDTVTPSLRILADEPSKGSPESSRSKTAVAKPNQP
jgi:cbb3-type cytochrome oxidase maturation protein